jgi:hypothetical protein
MASRTKASEAASATVPPPEVFAAQLARISESVQSLSKSGLNRRAIVALIHDNSGLAKSSIELVLNNLEALKANYGKL